MENVRELAVANSTYTETSFQALLNCFQDPTSHYIDAL